MAIQQSTFSSKIKIEEVTQQISKRLSKGDAEHLSIFISSFFSHIAEDDIDKYKDEDLKGLIATLFRYMQEAPKSNSILFNPNIEEHGWQSKHSILILHHRDVRYLIDSIRNMLGHRQIKIHRIFHAYFKVQRNAQGSIQKLVEQGASVNKVVGDNELFLYMEIDHHSRSEDIKELNTLVDKIVADVEVVAKDYHTITNQVDHVVAALEQAANKSSPDIVETINETKVFLDWLRQGHFTFLAYDEYAFKQDAIKLNQKSCLGLFRHWDKSDELFEFMSRTQLESAGIESPIIFSKSGQLSSVHRLAYLDYVVVNRFDAAGKVVGGYRFMGLYKHNVYLNSAVDIPIIRKKIQTILDNSKIPADTYNYVELSHILGTFPRDELFQASVEHLLNVGLNVLYIQERRKVRLFLRESLDQRFITAIFYAPKDILNARLREQVYTLLAKYIDIESSTKSTWFSESSLARCRLVFKLKSPLPAPLDQEKLERNIINLARDWDEDLQVALSDAFGEEKGLSLYQQYYSAFPAAYTEENSPRVAVADIERMQSLGADASQHLAFSFYRSVTAEHNELKIKIYHRGAQLSLSDMIPVLENFGLKVIEEYPYDIERESEVFWIYNFTVSFPAKPNIEPGDYRDILSEAFIAIWNGESDNDGFNCLVLKTGLNWRQITMLRAYSRYMKQISFGFSQKFIANSLIANTDIAKKLIAYFDCRFNPARVNADKKRSEKTSQRLASQLEGLFESVASLSEDRILRQYLELMQATLRTNFYQQGEKAKPYKDYLSLKLNPRKIKTIPLPRPAYEIFVYSPRVEGVHLRGGKVARGGLRWSDRTEDFRTEVLGLVKAQQVKNSVIVPVGAKGGFIAKRLPSADDREAFLAEGIACYKLFIRGLLDLTDNIVNGELIPPANLVRYDDDDTYLVVAADKGTATFSDIANGISKEYGHWLGDAFASGGSNGYDHKKMGITARGAWVSVQRHFREIGINIQQQPFTVVGIGDMSGDVFGNGMLLSEQTQLVGAFNHLHIFIDPKPDPTLSFAERQRLFQLPRSSWADYNKKLISKGGGIFSRAAKSINLSPEIQVLVNTDKQALTPNELISLLLGANVDMLWNGGIGTYIKASSEQHSDVGDKTNDVLRINADQLQCKVIGEGGNLGLTQQARIEYALLGGVVFTDFIDNAAGVDCSDHEVNIKILLDKQVADGELTEKQRNRQLENMTESVSQLVLKNNYRQTQAIALAHVESIRRTEEYRRVMQGLESSAKLDRNLEFLPSDEMLSERKTQQLGLSRPELSVLISYVKSDMKEVLMRTDLGDDSFIQCYLRSPFPRELLEKFESAVLSHPLKNEIIATQIANDMFNHMGISFVDRMQQSTGASHSDIAKVYVAAREIFNLGDIWSSVESLDYKVASDLQYHMMLRVSRLMRRGIRWLIKNHRVQLEVVTLIELYRDSIQDLRNKLPALLPAPLREQWQHAKQEMIAQGAPETLAKTLASCEYLYNFLGIIAASNTLHKELSIVASGFFSLAEKLELDDFAQHVENKMPTNTHWQALARESLRDDLEWQQRQLTQNMLSSAGSSNKRGNEDNIEVFIEEWLADQDLLITRWKQMVSEVNNYNGSDTAILNIAIRELSDLSQATASTAIDS